MICPRTREFMKKHSGTLFLILVLMLVTFPLANHVFFSQANATYVEGPITEDTVWTLTDSPYLISKNVTVQTDAKLTIEPGVEVKFGGNFSLIVEGSLNAVGEENNPIEFTSSKNEPAAGDWPTMEFKSATSSTLTFCVLEYAVNGITVVNSSVEIRNSEIRFNSKNGIVAANGVVNIQNSRVNANFQDGISIDSSVLEASNNMVSDNTGSGIYVTGTSQAEIHDNVLRANAHGIFLTGNSTVKANITRNLLSLHNQSGVCVDVVDYNNIAILYNTLSANNNGFYVSGRTDTQITNNSISYNNVGIFYESASHVAHWNDIYGNTLGMDVSTRPDVTVDAEYNYWGDETGPYHESLNPTGKGNNVSGDGNNLDFIFFLTASIDYENKRPMASLLTDKASVQPNQLVWFIATNSSDDRRVNQYFYDFGDGKNSGWTTLSIVMHEYSSTGDFMARVMVRDDFDVVSVNEANVVVSVQTLPSIDVSLTLDSSSVASGGKVSVVVQTSVGNAYLKLISVTPQGLEISFGSTNSTGYFTEMLNAPEVTEQTNVRIIATASKDEYSDGSNYEYLRVLPLLSVQVMADPSFIRSESTSDVIVQVTHNSIPVSDAAVNIFSDIGSFSPKNGSTDLNGSLAFAFTAPKVTERTNITVTATATKDGYFASQGQTGIAIDPKILTVQITSNTNTVESEASLNMTVHVTEDSNPVAGANVTLSSNLGGTFSVTTGTTDANGDLNVTFFAPQTTALSEVQITAKATKSGYSDGEDQTVIIVNPLSSTASSGLPWLTILLITIPIVVIAVVLVLIKKGIIVISRE